MDILSSIWKVSYSTKKDLDRGRMKAYDGTMKFWSSNGWIVLLNAKDEPIAVQVIPLGQCFKPGTKVTFPHHVVRVGCTLYGSSAVLENPPVEALVLAPANMVGSTSADGDWGKHSGNLHELDSAAESVQNNLDPSFDVHTSIAMGLNFKAGYNFAKEYENDQQWTLVSPSKQRAKLGMDALNLPAPKPALKHNSSINKKLVFAETIHYEARKGYAAVGSSSTNLNMYQTETTHVISFGTTFPITKGQEQVADKVQSSTIPVLENQVIKQTQKPDDMTQKTANIPIADQVNHRAEQGFRKGWLMFVGMNPDYRNDLDIANAVSTFGKFLYWNHTDPILERGADVLPADEDPMPPDSNPHPMPGNMQQFDNLFVPPQFPEIGWNMVPMEQGPMGQHNHQHDDMQQQDLQEKVQQQIQEFDQDIEEAESMVLVPSDSSGDSVNMVQDNHIVVQYMHHLESPVLPHAVDG
ncbi:hypothetical protein ACQ4PT_025312 [Festuca glaucescens]